MKMKILFMIHEKFKEFQSDFWQKQHRWYTEYCLSRDSPSIYTIPYAFDTYQLISDTDRYCNETMNNSNTFDNVTDLIIGPDALTETCQYHFSHVTSLTLGDTRKLPDHTLWEIRHIEHLKMIFNLF